MKLYSTIPLAHVSWVPSVVEGSVVVVVSWHDGRRAHTIHVHVASDDATPDVMRDLELMASQRHRPALRLVDSGEH